MSENQPYIDPNSGAASQPGGFVTPGYTEPVVEETPEEVVASQIQDDPSGQDAVDPDAVPAEEQVGDEDKVEEKSDEPTEVITGPDEIVASGDQVNEPQPVPNEQDETVGANPVASEAYNPSDHNAADVVAYIKEHPEEKDAIIAAEKADKDRSTITGA